MPELKLIAGRSRKRRRPPKLKPVTIVERRRAPGWVAVARHYEHEVIGPFKIWTVAVADQGDVICAQKLFDWVYFWHECDRKNAREKAEKRAARRKAKGKPGGSERPPAEPRGGGKAA